MCVHDQLAIDGRVHLALVRTSVDVPSHSGRGVLCKKTLRVLGADEGPRGGLRRQEGPLGISKHGEHPGVALPHQAPGQVVAAILLCAASVVLGLIGRSSNGIQVSNHHLEVQGPRQLRTVWSGSDVDGGPGNRQLPRWSLKGSSSSLALQLDPARRLVSLYM